MSCDHLLLGAKGGGVAYVTGHRHPDTDSIVSAIAYAHLRHKQGANIVPCRLGELTPESAYLLDRFNQADPLLITDARSQIDETELDDGNAVSPADILRTVVEKYADGDQKVFTVQDSKGRLLGMVTNSSLSKVLLLDTERSIDLLGETPIENIVKAIGGKLVYAPEETDHNGKVSIIALSANNLKFYDLENRIVILGNDTNAQLEAIRKGAAALVLVWTKEIAPMVMKEARAQQCALILSGHGAMNTSRFIYYAIPVSAVMEKDMIAFNNAEFVDDVRSKMLQSRHRAYPVVDEENRVLGLTSRYQVLNAPRRRFILVDHNDSQQSVPHIEKGEIVEIIDHHRLGDLTSDNPIYVRNEPVGATATIISEMFLEQGIEPDKDIAGLLLAAIIADTLNFKSPTTTAQDVRLAKHWAEYTGLEPAELAADIFAASSQKLLEDLDKLIRNDVKEYLVGDKRVLISQHTMYRLNEANSITGHMEEKLEEEAAKEGAYLWAMMFTSARDSGSIFYAGGEGKPIIEMIFPNKADEAHTFQAGVVSRKNQVMPKLLQYLRDNNG